MEKSVFNERTGQSDQMANGHKRKLNFSRSDRKEFHFPELPFTIQPKEVKGMEGTYLLASFTNLQDLFFNKTTYIYDMI